MLSKEQKIEKLKKIVNTTDKINSLGSAFIAKKIDDIEEQISLQDKRITEIEKMFSKMESINE